MSNKEEGLKWYLKAAEQGHAEAQYDLGYCYYYGNGVKQSYKEAAKWLRKAAEQGHAEAQYNLGYCYYNGYGVERSYEEAAEWSAEQGYEKAIVDISKQYDFNILPEKLIDTANSNGGGDNITVVAISH